MKKEKLESTDEKLDFLFEGIDQLRKSILFLGRDVVKIRYNQEEKGSPLITKENIKELEFAAGTDLDTLTFTKDFLAVKELEELLQSEYRKALTVIQEIIKGKKENRI